MAVVDVVVVRGSSCFIVEGFQILERDQCAVYHKDMARRELTSTLECSSFQRHAMPSRMAALMPEQATELCLS